MWSDRDREAEEAGERRLGRAAAGEPEHELVQVGLEVLLAQAVVDAQGPALRVREHPVHPGQDQVGRGVADHPRVVLDVLELGVAGPAVAHHRAAVRDVGADEAAQARGRVVPDHRQPGPPRALALDLDPPPDQQPALVRPAGAARPAPRAPPPLAPAPPLISLPAGDRPARAGPPPPRKGRLVSSTSTSPASGSRSGSTIAARSFRSNNPGDLEPP